jgi:hypothetical protein
MIPHSVLSHIHILNEDWTFDNLDTKLPAIKYAFDVTCIDDTRLAISNGDNHQISILAIPRGVLIIATSWNSHNLSPFILWQLTVLVVFVWYMLSPDGKRCRTVLGESDGIDKPTAIYFDKVKNNLVVCNENGTAFLYKVE